MKRIVSVVLLLIYTSFLPVFAFSELYYLQNIQASQIEPLVETKFTEQHFNIVRKNPYYVISNNNSADAAIIILQQSGNGVFYYYKSDNNKKLNTTILKTFKAANISYELSQNYNSLSIYDKLAQDILTNAFENRYNFEEVKSQPVVQNPVTNNNHNITQKTTLYGSVVQVPAGESFNVYLNNPINTASATTGENVTAVLTSDWVYNGLKIASQGSLVYGTITLARAAQYCSRNGRVVIEFNKLVTPEGMTYNISTDKVDFSVTNDGKINKTVQSTVARAVVGAATGLILAALFGSKDTSLGRAAAIGAGVGAGTAVLGAATEMGVDAEIPSFTELDLTLTKMFTVSKSYSNGE